MTETGPRPSPLALAVLGLLAGGPLHPYRMQRLLKEWGKDEVINVGQRANLYAAIKRLPAGLIAVRHTERELQYPERTVYEITDDGRNYVHNWLTDIVASPRNEYPAFPAALSFVMLLGPDATAAALEARATRLEEQLHALDGALAEHGRALPRVTLLETEYQRAVVSAELDWVRRIVADLRGGQLEWTDADFAFVADAFVHDGEAKAPTVPSS